jgi:hypothetical protein
VQSFILFLALATSPVPDLVDHLNSPENEISIAVTAAVDEVWIERRAGAWGSSGHKSRLLTSRWDASLTAWSPLEPVPFADPDANEGDPFFDDHSDTLYFVSDRAHPGLPDSGGNIWRARRVAGQWDAPEPLPPPVNGSGAEYSPVARGNRLYFASDRGESGDLFVAAESPQGWAVERLGAAINSPTGEWNLWVAPAEDLLIFEASERSTNVSIPGDLYGSVKDGQGAWLPAVPLSSVNGPGSELNALLFADVMVFSTTSGRSDQADFEVAGLDVRAVVNDAYRHRLFVANRSSHSLSEIDLGSGRIVAAHPTGPGPHLLSTSPSGTIASVAYGQYPEAHEEPVEQAPKWVATDGGRLLLLDTALADAEPIVVELPCNRPHGSAWSDSGDRLWLTCEDRLGVVELRDPGLQSEMNHLESGKRGAHVAAWDSAHRQLVVAHTEAGGVAFMDPAAAESSFLELAPGAEAIHLLPGLKEAWITLGPSGRVAVVDLLERNLITTLEPGCGFPIDFAVDSRGLVWIACLASRELVAVDASTRSVTERIALPAGPLNVVAHPALPVLYVSTPRRNEVLEASISGSGITRRFSAGIEPDGMVIVPARQGR